MHCWELLHLLFSEQQTTIKFPSPPHSAASQLPLGIFVRIKTESKVFIFSLSPFSRKCNLKFCSSCRSRMRKFQVYQDVSNILSVNYISACALFIDSQFVCYILLSWHAPLLSTPNHLRMTAHIRPTPDTAPKHNPLRRNIKVSRIKSFK